MGYENNLLVAIYSLKVSHNLEVQVNVSCFEDVLTSYIFF